MRSGEVQVKPLVLGVGNVLLGDEGIGVEAVRYLESAGFGRHADLLDGGTGGFHLLGLFHNYQKIILIDATCDSQPPGTVSLLKPRFASDFPPSLSAHDIGLKDLLESAALLGALPEVDLITVSIAGLSTMSLSLSDRVKAALPLIEKTVATCLEGRREAHQSTCGELGSNPSHYLSNRDTASTSRSDERAQLQS